MKLKYISSLKNQHYSMWHIFHVGETGSSQFQYCTRNWKSPKNLRKSFDEITTGGFYCKVGKDFGKQTLNALMDLQFKPKTSE